MYVTMQLPHLRATCFLRRRRRPKAELMAHRGYNIGTRLIEDFLARTGMGRCQSFAETAEVISKVSAGSAMSLSLASFLLVQPSPEELLPSSYSKPQPTRRCTQPLSARSSTL
jgi:hypothetical protein